MTTLYRPVLIESAEQAEALPAGTLLIHDRYAPLFVVEDEDGKTVSLRRGSPSYLDVRNAVGWTALVPIEAEEEFTAMGTDDGEHWIAHVGPDGITGSREDAEAYTRRFGGFIARRNRTPWEEA